MIISETGGTSFAPCPAGSFMARCCRIVDLGTQTTDFLGETKTVSKVLLSWQIQGEKVSRDEGQPFLLNKRYTTSPHEKSALCKDLTSWHDRDLTPQEL